LHPIFFLHHVVEDDKQLTCWNALAISALAMAYRVLHEPSYLEAAQKATRFIKTYLWKDGEFLLRRYRDGDAKFEGTLDDYAYLINGSLFRSSILTKALIYSQNINRPLGPLFS